MGICCWWKWPDGCARPCASRTPWPGWGDEFVLVLQNLATEATDAAAQVRTVCEQVLAQLRQPYLLDGHEHHVTASIGATLLCQPDATVDEVLKQADLAMYRAKDAGRNTLRFFDPDMQAAVNQPRALLEAEMHTGLRLAQFLLLYQPQVDRDGRVTGAEVLLRWQRPDQGQVSRPCCPWRKKPGSSCLWDTGS